MVREMKQEPLLSSITDILDTRGSTKQYGIKTRKSKAQGRQNKVNLSKLTKNWPTCMETYGSCQKTIVCF